MTRGCAVDKVWMAWDACLVVRDVNRVGHKGARRIVGFGYVVNRVSTH